MAKQDEYLRITARLPPEVHGALVELAKRTERSLNGELVARLQSAIKMADAEAHSHAKVMQTTAKYQVGDPVHALIEMIKAMPEEKQRALLELLK